LLAGCFSAAEKHSFDCFNLFFGVDIIQIKNGNHKTGKIFTVTSLSTSLVTALASCLMYAWAFPAHPYNEMGSDQSAVRVWPIVVWIRSFIEPDLFENNVPFDNTTPIYLLNLLW